MNTKLTVRPRMDARLQVVLPADEKQALFEAAAKRRIRVSELIHRGIAWCRLKQHRSARDGPSPSSDAPGDQMHVEVTIGAMTVKH